MSKLVTKKRALIGLCVVALASTGVAYAYWTASGTGSGTASTGTDSGVTISGVTFDNSLYPGGSTTVHFTIKNNSTTAPVKVDKVKQNGPVSGLASGCLAADFSFANVAINHEFAASESQDYTGTLSMANTTANQDACKSGAPVLGLTTDNSGI
jgi:hypothetical protein